MKRPSPEHLYAKVARAILAGSEAKQGSGKKGVGASALKIKGKIFAMLSSKGEFVVKLPREVVDELVASRKGKRFEPGPGRVMKEWVVLSQGSSRDWLPLARQAMEFVASRG